MARYTVRLDDDSATWVDAQASERDRSKAWVIEQAVRAARDADSVYADSTDPHRDGARDRDQQRDAERVEVLVGAVLDRLDDLEDRLDAIAVRKHDDQPAVSFVDTESVEREIDGGREVVDELVDDTDPSIDLSRDRDRERAREDRVRAVVEHVAADWEDAPSRLEARKEAAAAGLRFALDVDGAVGRSDAVAEFFEEYPVPNQNEETWWRQNVRPVLSAVGEYAPGAHGYVVETGDDLDDVLDS